MKNFKLSMKTRIYISVFATVFAVLLAVGLLLPHAGLGKNIHSADSQNADFDAFTQELFRTQLCTNTLNLHYTLAHPENYGIDDYPVTFGEYSLAAMQQSMQNVRDCLQTLESFDYDSLSGDRQLTYDCMRAALSTEQQAADVLPFSELLGPTTGFQAQLPVLLAEYTFYDEQDVADYLQLLEEVRPYFAQILAFERQKAADGLFMPFYAVEDIIEQCASLLAGQETHFLVTTFADRLDGLELSAEKKESYIAANAAALQNSFFPAYEELIAGLRDLESTGKNPYGLCYFENGKTYYEYLVASGTGCSDSIDDMYADVLAHLHKTIDAQHTLLAEHPDVLQKTKNTLLPTGGADTANSKNGAADGAANDTGDAASSTADDAANNENSSADDAADTASGAAAVVHIDPAKYLADLQEKCATDFPALSDASYTVRAVDACLEAYLSPAFYLTPTLDASSRNVIYLNHGHAYSPLSLYTTLAHEGFPGHLYQNVWSRRMPLSDVRALFGTTGYAEGWATYAEQFAYSYADIDADVAALYQQSSQMSLALSAALDIGIHYYYWTPDDAADFLADYGILGESIVGDLYEYIVEEPANYLNYEIGYLQFLHLRDIAEKECGSDFDLKEFHETLLTIGEAPFAVVETYMRRLL